MQVLTYQCNDTSTTDGTVCPCTHHVEPQRRQYTMTHLRATCTRCVLMCTVPIAAYTLLYTVPYIILS